MKSSRHRDDILQPLIRMKLKMVAYPDWLTGVMVCSVEVPLIMGVAREDRGTAMLATAAGPETEIHIERNHYH